MKPETKKKVTEFFLGFVYKFVGVVLYLVGFASAIASFLSLGAIFEGHMWVLLITVAAAFVSYCSLRGADKMDTFAKALGI